MHEFIGAMWRWSFWWVEAGWRHFPSTCNSRCFFEKVHLWHVEYGPALLPDLRYCCIQLLGSRVRCARESWTKTFKNIGIHFWSICTFHEVKEHPETMYRFLLLFFEIPFFKFYTVPVGKRQVRWENSWYISIPVLFLILRLDVSFQHHCR